MLVLLNVILVYAVVLAIYAHSCLAHFRGLLIHCYAVIHSCLTRVHVHFCMVRTVNCIYLFYYYFICHIFLNAWRRQVNCIGDVMIFLYKTVQLLVFLQVKPVIALREFLLDSTDS